MNSEVEDMIAKRELEIAEKKQIVEVPQIDFRQKSLEAVEEEHKVNTNDAGGLVNKAFEQAIIHRVANDAEVQENLLGSAKTVIDNKLNAIKSDAEQEDKKANFNNKKGACECFGYNEATTEKWAVNTMNVWHNIMTAIWLGLGFFTFAPITFIAKKVAVIFKKSWLAVLIAILIYVAIITVPIVLGLINY